MKKFFICALIFSALFLSCKEKNKEISLADNDSLALAVDIEWAVVTDPYVSFRESKSFNSKERSHAQKGEVLQIKGYSYAENREKWVQFNEGFLPISSVKIYTNKYQAEKAARDLGGAK